MHHGLPYQIDHWLLVSAIHDTFPFSESKDFWKYTIITFVFQFVTKMLTLFIFTKLWPLISKLVTQRPPFILFRSFLLQSNKHKFKQHVENFLNDHGKYTQKNCRISLTGDSLTGCALRSEKKINSTIYFVWLLDRISDPSGGEVDVSKKPRNLLRVGNIQNFGALKFSLDPLNLGFAVFKG